MTRRRLEFEADGVVAYAAKVKNLRRARQLQIQWLADFGQNRFLNHERYNRRAHREHRESYFFTDSCQQHLNDLRVNQKFLIYLAIKKFYEISVKS